MRFAEFTTPIPEWDTLQLTDEIAFEVHRAGHPKFQRRQFSKFGEKIWEKLETATKERGGSLTDLAGADRDLVLANLDLSDLGGFNALQDAMEPDYEGIATILVRRQTGPLILEDDSDERIPWTREIDGKMAGVLFFEANPGVAVMVLEFAQRLEADYQEQMEASRKNSSTSSAPAGTEEAPSESSGPSNVSGTVRAN